MIIESVKKYLESLPPDRDPKKISMSSLGHCQRQLAYRHHGQAGRSLDWKALSIFDDGNKIHDQVRGWLRLALVESPFELVMEEADVEVATPKGRRVGGHCDGVLKPRSASGPAPMLLEVKSMADYAFEKLVSSGELDEGYVVQATAYMRGLSLASALVLAKNKNTSELFEVVLKPNDAALDKRLAILDTVLDSESAPGVEREHKPNPKGFLPWQCGYCPFWKTCWEDYGPVEKSRNKVQLVNWKEEK